MLLLVLGTACSLALTACHGDDDSTPPPDTDSGAGGYAGAHQTIGGPITGDPDEVERFLREYAAAVCVMYHPCCIDEGQGYDGEGCTQWMYDLIRSYSEGEFRPDAAAHCMAAFDEARAQDPNRCKTEFSFDEATLRTECSAAFVRAPRSGAQLGGDCHWASECASSTDGEVTCFEGRCLLQRQGAVGDGPCLFDTLVGTDGTDVFICNASDDLYCDLVDNVCTPFPDVGAACPHLGSCGRGAECLLDVCSRLPETGEDCLNTIPGLCARGSACDAEHSICGPAFETGEPCELSGQCVSGACRDDVCAVPEFVARMSCTGED